MGKTGETNGVEELLDATCDDVGTGDNMIIFEELGEEGDAVLLGVDEAPPSPCPTEVIDQWANWREDEVFATVITPNSSPPGSVAPPGSPSSTTDGYATPVNFGSGVRESIAGSEGNTESPSYGTIFYSNVASNSVQNGIAGAQNYMTGGIVASQGYFRNVPPAFVALESNERPHVNFDTNGNAPQLPQYHHQQQQLHNYTANVPQATGWMQPVPAPGPAVSNFAGAPLFYAVQGNFSAGQGSGGTILGANGGAFVGTPGQNQPLIFVQQPIFPQQQSVHGMPLQVMIDQFGINANPRSAWDSLLAQGGHNRVNDVSTTEYYTAYGGSGSYGGESIWNGGVASESATYYSYGPSYSTSEASSVQSQSLSPTKSDYSSTDASDASATSIASYSSIASSDQSYAPIAWTQHPTFPLSQTQIPQNEFQGNIGVFTGGVNDGMYQSNNFPVLPANFPATDHSLLQAISSQFDALNFASSANPMVSSSPDKGSSLNVKHTKGRGYSVRNKKKISAEKAIGVATTSTPASSYVVGWGNTFWMNGIELPFVLNIWDPSVTAMMMKMSPPQAYQYYVPPCVNDGDYFGGQLSLWQYKMVDHFQKFSPDIWRLQAVPDTSQNIVDGWFSFDIISKLRFCCRHCKMPWTTKKGKLQFFIKRNSENRIGYVYFKMYRQVCMKQDCPDWTLQNAACYPEEIDRAVSKLCEVVSSMYYGKALDPNLFTDCQKSIRVGPTDLTRLKSLTTS